MMRWTFTRKRDLDRVAADMASFGLVEREGTEKEQMCLEAFFALQSRGSVIKTINDHLKSHTERNFCGICGWIDDDCEHLK
jgi:hypothetical protein